MSISWGNYEFTDPEYLSEYNMPNYGGVYAIMFRPKHLSKPTTYRVLYFGITKNFSTRGIDESHHDYNCWIKNTRKNVLYVSIHKETSESMREQKEQIMIKKHNPTCNDK